MTQFNRKPAVDAPLSDLLAEMIGLGKMFSGRFPWAAMQPGNNAANQADCPLDPACDDLFENVPV